MDRGINSHLLTETTKLKYKPLINSVISTIKLEVLEYLSPPRRLKAG